MSSVEVESGDLIRLILQFCKENGLVNTFQTLQEESQISLNIVDNIDAFTNDILNGNWDQVLQQTSTLKLPLEKLMNLYEQIVIELVELHEIDTARALLRGRTQSSKPVMQNLGTPRVPPLQQMKLEQPDRYMKLERLLQKTSFDPVEAYGELSKESRRHALAQSLSSELSVVPPSRLLALAGQALKWQSLQGLVPSNGMKFDLFRGTPVQMELANETFPTELDKAIKFGTKTHSECARFTLDGHYLITGSVDGFVEVWNWSIGKLAKDLKYQANEQFMMHDDSVLSINFSMDGEYLVSGSQDGKLKVWEIRSGKCARRFENAHAQGITCVCFTKDGSHLLSGSFDQTIRVHGLKSGKTLRIFRGHTSFVNECIFTYEGSRVVSASSDGTIKVWDYKTTDCQATFSPIAQSHQIRDVAINTVILLPKNPEQIVVCNRSTKIYIMNLKGQVLRTFSSEKNANCEFISCCLSPRGDWLYAIAEDCHLYCFNVSSGEMEHSMKVHDKEVIGLAHHPYLNLIVTYSADGQLKLWK